MSAGPRLSELNQIIRDWADTLEMCIGIIKGEIVVEDKNAVFDNEIALGERFIDWWTDNQPICPHWMDKYVFSQLIIKANMPFSRKPCDLLAGLLIAKSLVPHLEFAATKANDAPLPDGPLGDRGWRHDGQEFWGLHGGETMEIMREMHDKPNGHEIELEGAKRVGQLIRENCSKIGLPWSVSCKRYVVLVKLAAGTKKCS